MGKQGPCCHCGVTSTPLWRNGPPEKPVLCNACGSRWRTKGTLVNYTPLHARADLDDFEDHRFSRLKNTSMSKNKEIRLLKRKPNHDSRAFGVVAPDYNQGYRKVFDEDMSNRSSSGSAVSNSESCAQFGSAEASDLTGPAQSVVWDSMVPSRKRTCYSRPKPSSVEKLTKDLYTILHEQQQSSCFSGSSEDDLLFETETPMVSVEIGHGSVLIRHPSSIARDEESEASSLSFENKRYSSTNEVYSHSVTLPVHNEKKSVRTPCLVTEEAKNPNGQRMQQDQFKREKSIHDKLQLLTNHNSPLRNIDLNDIINFEEFSRHLTFEEQQQLLKYLPPLDTAELSDSVKNMFVSSQFKENVSSYQQLLVEGIFDLSFSGAKVDDCKTLKRIALSNFSKSNWVERYQLLKKCKSSNGKSLIGRGPTVITSSNSVNAKKSRDGQNQRFPEAKTMMSPKRLIMKVTHESKEHVDNDGSCFSPRSLFALPSDGSSLMMDPLHFGDESYDQDVLLDVPSNGSYPQAELLHPSLSFGQQASTSSSSIYPRRYQP